MKLQQLLKRENFPRILIDSISTYFEATSAWEGEIIWGRHGDSKSLNFLINDKLNIIYPCSMAKEQLMPLVAEYSYSKHPLRSWAQKIYINFALSAGFRSFFASGKLQITQMDLLPSYICILPGNHTNRIVSFDNDECIVILKTGFSAIRLENTVAIRSSYPDLPGPKLLESNLMQGWYREERIFGMPLNRVSNSEQVNKALSSVKLFLDKMYDATMINEEFSVWMEGKRQKIEGAINSLPSCYARTDIQEVKLTKSMLFLTCHNLIDDCYAVKVSQSHGDLQDANLLLPSDPDKREVYIIDWEYADRRCAHYDWFVYGLQSRSPNRLAERIGALIKANKSERSSIAWFDLSEADDMAIRRLILLFLVDEFLFRLDDTCLPNLDEKADGFITFIKEIRILLESNF